MGDSEKEVKGDVAVSSSPVAKKPKLKQASLFDVLKPKAPPPKTTKSQILSPISNNKKRKSTDLFHTVNPKGARVIQNDNITKSKRLKVDDGENEVSSSSEPDASKTSLKENIPGAKQPKITGSLDRFVRTTQQREVSTSCTVEEEVVDLTDDDAKNQVPESELVIPDTSQDDGKTETNQTKKDEAKEDTNEKQNSETNDLDQSSLSAKDDTEESMDVDSELDASLAADNDANKSLDSTVSETDSPKEKENGSTPASRPKRAVKSSSKKEERERERLRLKEEKEKQKEKEKLERQKKLEAAKAEKERLKKEEKERKDKERAEQKLAREKEKQAKLDQIQKDKDEKQKKKQEEIDAKNEEKRKRDEEKKQMEDEKKKMEEEKLAKKKQNEQKFKSFFKKTDKPAATSPKPEITKSRFIPFQIKDNMKMAPTCRRKLPEETKSALDDSMAKQVSESYLSELKGRTTGKSEKTWSTEDMDVVCTDEDKQKTGTVMKAKFLFFHVNHRPPYFGTWRKVSKSIKARKPLAQDTEFLDYEVDSDDEWEEEEPGESLSNSEKEDEQEEGGEVGADDDDEDDDGFFVPHGYLSDDEMNEDDEDDITPERLKARQLAKAKAFEAEMKQQTKVMSSLVIGCVWWNPHTSGTQSDPNYNKLGEFAIQPLNKTTFPIDVSCEVKEETKSKKSKSEDKGANFQPVPDEAIPDLVRLVHGNSEGVQKLIKEFREYWRVKSLGNDTKRPEEAGSVQSPMEVDQNTPDVQNTSANDTPTKGSTFSKRQLDMKIKSIAVYEKRDTLKRNCWYVHQKVLEEHKLTDLPVPSEWQWITRPNVTPKVATTPKSGRRTPTLIATPTHTKIQQFAVKMTPEQLAETMPKPEPKASPAPPPVISTPTRPNIQKFAVKMTPEQLAKSMPAKVENKAKAVPAKVESKAPPARAPTPTSSLQEMLRKTSEANPSKKIPSVSTIPKSVFDQPDGAVPSTSGSTSDEPTSVFQRMIIGARQAHYQKKEADSTCDSDTVNVKSISASNEDDDCMIVDEEGPSLPLVAPKGQPTLFSVLKKSIVN